jgi:hypothetical protein
MPPEDIVERPVKSLNEINTACTAAVDKTVETAKAGMIQFVTDVKEICLDLERLPEAEKKAGWAILTMAFARFSREQDELNKIAEAEFNK